MSSTISPAATTADARRVSLLVGVLFGLTGLGSSSAAIALPVMASDFGVSTGVSAWAISLYALMLAVATAVYGRISDLVGVRLPLAVGVGLMTAGALAGALAPSFGSLLVARIVQGAGAAAVPTLGVAIISARYSGSDRGMALGRVAGFAAAVSCIGPFAGGVIEGLLDWRAVIALPCWAPCFSRCCGARCRPRAAAPGWTCSVRPSSQGPPPAWCCSCSPPRPARPWPSSARHWPCSAYQPSLPGYAAARTASCPSR